MESRFRAFGGLSYAFRHVCAREGRASYSYHLLPIRLMAQVVFRAQVVGFYRFQSIFRPGYSLLHVLLLTLRAR